MVLCKNLIKLNNHLQSLSVTKTYSGKPWSNVQGEWIYYDCVLSLDKIRENLKLDVMILNHVHLGTHDGKEQGFYCENCQDGIMGLHPEYRGRSKVINGSESVVFKLDTCSFGMSD